jgi:F-type H+-transporting ATPase subunit b
MKTKTTLFLIIFILLSSVAFASGDGHGFSWSAFFGKVLNSTLLFGGLFFLLKKPVSKMLGDKTVELRDDIRKREDNLERSTTQYEELLRRLEDMEAEIDVMKEEAKQGGKVEMKRLEQLGKEEADKILQFTREEIQTRSETAVRNLKARIAQMAIDGFKEDIKSRLNEDMHQKIIDKNIDISGDIIENE